MVMSEKDQEKKPRMPVINISVHYNFRTLRQCFSLEMGEKKSLPFGKKEVKLCLFTGPWFYVQKNL